MEGNINRVWTIPHKVFLLFNVTPLENFTLYSLFPDFLINIRDMLSRFPNYLFQIQFEDVTTHFRNYLYRNLASLRLPDPIPLLLSYLLYHRVNIFASVYIAGNLFKKAFVWF